MGDTRRHEIFTRFISKTFPWVEELLLIAVGKAQIARKLADRGMRLRVIEADSRYAGQPHPLITYLQQHLRLGPDGPRSNLPSASSKVP